MTFRQILRGWLCSLLGFVAFAAEPAMQEPSSQAGPVQTALLNPGQPLFVPTHMRVTTTLRFPGPIGAPEGRGFTEDDSKVPGEYLVAWTRGEHHLTVTPLPGAGALNLNVPYEGQTYVFYFYPVERQFQALASLNLVVTRPAHSQSSAREPAINDGAVRQQGLQPLPASPARLLGLVDKLRLVRALAPGAGLEALVKSLGLELVSAYASGKGAEWREAGGLELMITHVVRDPGTVSLGFALRMRNPAGVPRAPDVTNVVIRCGGRTLGGAMGDLPGILMPGEEQEAFLAAPCPPDAMLSADNDWRISLGVLP